MVVETPKLLDPASPAILQRLNGLNDTKRQAIIKRANDTPKSARLGYLRATCKLCSPKSAIKAFCMMCIGYERDEITHCSAYACPLYAFRPFQTRSRDKANGVSNVFIPHSIWQDGKG